MRKFFSSHKVFLGVSITGLLLTLFFINFIFIVNRPTSLTSSADLICPTPEGAGKTLQFRTCYLPSPTPTPKPIPSPIPPASGSPTPGQTTGTPNPSRTPIPVTTPAIGGPNHPDTFYCIDDEDPEGCDDNSSFLVPKGTGGTQRNCGTVIEQGHKLLASLPQGIKGSRNSLHPAVTNCGYSSGTYSGNYLSTYFIIDAYNLAGFTELSKNNPSHVSPTSLLSWWQSSPPGYTFIPYSPTVLQQYASGQQNFTGCVLFLTLPSGNIHTGMVNKLELYTSNGDGVLSILQAGGNYFLDRFVVAGWDIQNTPQHQTSITGVAGFGCHL